MPTIIPVILCGGAGSRLWPVSRELHPKPFMRLDCGKTLLQKAFLRAALLPDVSEVLVVTGQALWLRAREELSAVNQYGLPVSFLLEPVGRNTAASIAAACLAGSAKPADETCLLVLPADHLIENEMHFADSVSEAVVKAANEKIIVFGIQPTRPETAYGYIEIENEHFVRFVEKPSQAQADVFFASGNYRWNAGIFCFQPAVMLAEMDEHCPDILSGVRSCMENSQNTLSETGCMTLDNNIFAVVPEQSIDYAVMEKSGCVDVVCCDAAWSDLGSWNAISALFEADSAGNTTAGDVFLQATERCHIQSENRLVGAVGVQDLVIVDTADALLVAGRNQVHEVKKLYQTLKTAGHPGAQLHRTVFRPWGTYTVLEEGPGFKIKRIEMKPHASLSLQIHQHRSEHWVVVAGRASVINGEQILEVCVNQSVYIPAGNRHRLSNPDDATLIIIEVQSGSYLGEDDIVRLEDVYGRV